MSHDGHHHGGCACHAPQPGDVDFIWPGETSPRPHPRRSRTVQRALPKIGRNDPCYCNSGRKFKACCLNK